MTSAAGSATATAAHYAQTELFGIVREALADVVKHAGASNAWVHVDAGSEHVVVEVGDDGSGFDRAARTPVTSTSSRCAAARPSSAGG